MQINVDLEASKVNDAISKAVVESRLGEALKERIEKFLNNDGYGKPRFSDAMHHAVDSELQRILMDLIHNEYAESIREKVRAAMTEEVVTELVTKAIDKVHSRW